MKTCIIHVGTHKTGTTSLQVFVEQNRATLHAGGMYLPRTGRPSFAQTGNHQLGWDLLVEGRSNDLPTLTQELRTNPVDAALLTSEDLCLLYARPETLDMLANAIRAADYTPKVVIYFRPQAAYAESMYVERVKHDYIRPVAGYIEQILTTGMYVPQGSPIQIEFRYTRMIEPFVRAFGRENVLLKAYEPGKPDEYIFTDFLTLLSHAAPGFGRATMDLSVSYTRANEGLNFGSLLDTAYQKLLPTGVPAVEPRALLKTHVPTFSDGLLAQRFALFSRAEYLQFLAAFGPENAAIEREYGIHIPFQSEADIRPVSDPHWEKATVERSIYDQLLQLWLDIRNKQTSEK